MFESEDIKQFFVVNISGSGLAVYEILADIQQKKIKERKHWTPMIGEM